MTDDNEPMLNTLTRRELRLAREQAAARARGLGDGTLSDLSGEQAKPETSVAGDASTEAHVTPEHADAAAEAPSQPAPDASPVAAHDAPPASTGSAGAETDSVAVQTWVAAADAELPPEDASGAAAAVEPTDARDAQPATAEPTVTAEAATDTHASGADADVPTDAGADAVLVESADARDAQPAAAGPAVSAEDTNTDTRADGADADASTDLGADAVAPVVSVPATEDVRGDVVDSSPAAASQTDARGTDASVLETPIAAAAPVAAGVAAGAPTSAAAASDAPAPASGSRGADDIPPANGSAGVDDAPAADASDAPRERSLLAYIANALIAAILIVVVGIGLAAIVVPAATGSTALTVMTSSMDPTLPAGTLVVVRPTEPKDIREGDVLTYQLRSGEPTLVTHRVKERYQLTTGEYQWVTQGDANPSPDVDRVKEVQAKGTVWYAIPYLGWVSAGLTGEWRMLLIPIAVLALFGYAAWMFFSGLRERRRAKAATA